MQSVQPIRAGVFANEPSADRAVDDLLQAGFTRQRISVVSAPSDPYALEPDTEDEAAHEDVRSVAPAGAHTRKTMLVGGVIGFILAAATVVIGAGLTGGLGPSITGLLLSAAAVGAVAGTFVGAMMSRGYEPAVADYHDQSLRKGQFLVSVEESEGGPPLTSADAVFQRAGVRSLPLPKG